MPPPGYQPLYELLMSQQKHPILLQWNQRSERLKSSSELEETNEQTREMNERCEEEWREEGNMDERNKWGG